MAILDTGLGARGATLADSGAALSRGKKSAILDTLAGGDAAISSAGRFLTIAADFAGASLAVVAVFSARSTIS